MPCRFNLFHEGAYGESPESAKVRYGNEVKRVADVLDDVLAKSEWLVGDKCTYADLAFTMWNMQSIRSLYILNARRWHPVPGGEMLYTACR